jgi:cysteine desulfurase
MYLDKEGHFTDEDLAKIDDRTKIVSFAAVSNVLGMKRPVKELVARAHAVGAVAIVDAAQAIPHMKCDVQDWDCDFLVFSGHKMLASAGTGVLYGKRDLLNDMEPFLLGGDMIEYVQEQTTTFNVLPFKFEAGTENVEGAVALHAAIKYLNNYGWDKIEEHEYELTKRCLEGMKKLPYIHIIGSTDANEKTGVIAFTIDGVHPHDAATILDSYGIAIRSGHHCAQPYGAYIKAEASNRVSFYIYNTPEEVDYFLEVLPLVRKQMGFKD